MMGRRIVIQEFIKKHPWRFAGTVLVAFMASCASILMPLGIGKFYMLAFGFQNTKSRLLNGLPGWFFESVSSFMVFFIALVFLYFILNYGQRYAIRSLGEFFVAELREDLFRHQLLIDLRVYEERGSGKYLLRYSGDLRSVQNYLTKGLIGFGVDMGLIVLTFMVLLSINIHIGIICMGATIFILIPVSVWNKKLHQISVQRRNRRSGLLAFVNQRLQAMPTVHAFNREKPESLKFQKKSRMLLESGLNYHAISGLLFVVIPTLLYLMIAVVMWQIHLLQSRGVVIDQAGLLAGFILLITALPVFRRLLRVTVVWELGKISFDKLLAIMNMPTQERFDAPDLVMDEPHIQLNNLTFGQGNFPLYHSVNKEWKGFGLHLVEGKTGEGKSSLVKLLLGIYQTKQGEILIDGQAMNDLNVKSLRKHISVISEEYPLLGKTVFEAISYSRKPSKRKAANRMLQLVQEHLPAKLRMQLDDPLQDNAVGVSKGQAKLLLITRALLTKKPVLLIDEPFAQIGEELQTRIEGLLEKLRSKRLIICMMKSGKTTQLTFDSILSLSRPGSTKVFPIQRKIS